MLEMVLGFDNHIMYQILILLYCLIGWEIVG